MKIKEVLKDTSLILKMIHQISKSFIVIMFISNIIKAVLPYVNIIFSYLILDALILKNPQQEILRYVYIMVGLNLILGLTQTLLTRIINYKTEFINRKMKSKIAQKSLTLDYEQLEKKDNMNLLHKAQEGSNSHGSIVGFCDYIGETFHFILSLIISIVIFSSIFVVLPIENPSTIEAIFNSPYLTIALIFIICIIIYINFKFMQIVSRESYAFFEDNVDNNRKFSYFMLLGINYKFGKDVRTYNMSDLIANEMDNANNIGTRKMRKLAKLQGKYNGLSNVMNQLAIFLTYSYVGIKAILGFISVGSVLMYVSALTKFNSSLSGLISNWTQIDLQRQYLINYSRFLDIKNTKYQGTLPIEKRDDNQYQLEFKNVSFHYPNNEEMILKNVSLKVNVGQKMAIVGPNGAGKTTFIKLLCRLYDPTSGEILLNGIDIRKYDYDEYLRIFSVVFQDFKLFSFSVGENIASSTEVDEQIAWVVLEQSGIANRVKDMEEGLNTVLYQQNKKKGIEISGGEAQKIAIAKALYKDAPLVILDEPTSALDPVSEYEIYSRFNNLVSDKTSIYISHRMSSCRFCNHIIVFDKGEVVQIGDHNTLMKEQDSLYHKLWTAQAQYYNN